MRPAAGPLVTTPRVVLAALAALCALAIPLVVPFTRPPAALRAATVIVLALQATTCAILAWRARPGARRRRAEVVALIAIAAATAVPGYFFGPNAGFAALCALLVVAGGLVTGATDARASAVAGWWVYGALAGGQAVVVALVLTGALPDRSLTVVDIPGHPRWHHVAAHAALQAIYLVAFVAARRFQRRYRALAAEVAGHQRDAARRRALVAEARADYARALALGKGGVFAGQTVGGFELGALVGRGGDGEVYAAVDPATGAPAAVKVLRGDRLGDPDAVARFVDETSVIARVASPHVARVFAVGGPEAALPFLAMERLDGDDLATYVRRRGPLPPDELAGLLDALVDALTAIHAAGVAHLDVAPGNVVRAVGPGGFARWTLVDLGAARGEGAPRGHARHAAPERVRGGAVDGRADVYGLASVLYTAATGGEPHAALDEPATALATRMPDAPAVPPPLAAALAVGLARDPSARFADVAAAGRAFHGALAGVLDRTLAAAAEAVLVATPWGSGAPTAVVDAPVVDAPPPAAPPSGSAGSSVSWSSESSVPSVLPAEADPAWLAAYRGKMRAVYLAVTALCVGGAALFAIIIVDRLALTIAWASMAAVVAIMALHAGLTRRRGDPSAYWPWALIGAASVGPAYALGLHSGFAAIIAVVLFAGGLFRGSLGTAWYDRRAWVLVAVVVAHTAVFAAIAAGALADRGNVAVHQPGAARWEPYALHAALIVVYAIAFAAGYTVDRRQRSLLAAAATAAELAARQEALLATARAELDRALAGETVGIFSQLRVDHFAVGRLLGRGGMGEVYQALDTRADRPVALKLVRGDRVGDPRFLRRFEAEAQAMARVESAHVARVYAVGGLERDLPYIAMELVTGESLAARLRQRERLALDEVAALVADAAAGLGDLHRAGVIHRDVKPDNLVQLAGGAWKLVDLGLAKLGAGAASDALIVGTPAYMAPEQVDGAAVDARADLYSLTLVLYRALVGRPAFTGRDPVAIAAAARRGPPSPSTAAELPRDVILALRVGLAADPGDRFADAGELAWVFAEALTGRMTAAWRARATALLARCPWA